MNTNCKRKTIKGDGGGVTCQQQPNKHVIYEYYLDRKH